MPTLTLYNCGTKFNRHHPTELIAKLGRVTNQPYLITDGVGSGHPVSGKGAPGKHGLLTGGVFGVGIDDNVGEAVNYFATEFSKGGLHEVNLAGWSRGAVTCFKIANELDNRMTWSRVPVNIFAIDPVPGSTGAANHHVWRHIRLTQNIRRCVTIIAQHEFRRLFAPVLPALSAVPTTCKFTWLNMPGNHASIVVRKPGQEAAYEVVESLLRDFLAKRLTSFLDQYVPLTRAEVVEKYSTMFLEFANYEGNKPGKTPSKDVRIVKTQDSKGKDHKTIALPAARPYFFINLHDRKSFQKAWPNVFAEIDGRNSFQQNRQAWDPELTAMATQYPKTGLRVQDFMKRVGVLG